MPRPERTFWDLLSLPLWGAFFAVGLVPEPVFYALRDVASVTTQRAFVNTSLVITFAFACYYGLFVYGRCRDRASSHPEAQARGIQSFMLGLVAFLEFPSRGGNFEVRTLLELVLRVQEMPDLTLKAILLAVGALKLTCWFYLLMLVWRYHALGNRAVFVKSTVLFPSGRRLDELRAQPPEVEDSQPQKEPALSAEKWGDEGRRN